MSNDTVTEAGGNPLDTMTASVARVYDFVLGGKDNFEIDREVARKLLEKDPEVRVAAKLNKEFGRRVVDHMARQGVSQFLDLGSGIPTSQPSVHDTARRVNEKARVVYVDNDPVVVSHNRALRADGPGLAVIQESFMNIGQILAHRDVLASMDVDRPIGVLLLSVLQNTGSDSVMGFLGELRSCLAPGSYLAVTHVSTRSSQELQRAVAEESARGRYPVTRFREDEEIEQFFTGFDIQEPGLVDFRDWWPSTAMEDDRPDLDTLLTAGLGRLPG